MSGIDGPGFGHRLRITRLALGITEQEAADAAGSTVRTWRKWEAGGFSGCLKIVDFAGKFDVSLDWLVDGDTARVRDHLVKHANGKIAILPRRKPAA
jgi:transcriptional regulator with XRE-family HTH domain